MLAILALAACEEKIDDPQTDPQQDPEPVYETVTEFTEPQDIFGFQPAKRYAYCPAIVENGDGTSHVYFCGNPQAGRFVDNIYHIVVDADGKHDSVDDVLQPGKAGTWDSFHTCDPSVIQGEFKMGGESYKYAMFYLGIDTGDCLGNEVGVAFSNSLDATTWVKYPDVLIPFPTDHSSYWGVGQPSAVSLDKKGKVLLTYTEGYKMTTVKYEILDMSDMDNFTRGEVKSIPLAGIVTTNGIRDVANNADVAVNLEKDVIVMVRDVHPNPTTAPNFISGRVEVVSMKFSDFLEGKGTWTQICYISKKFTGYARNHNAGLSRDSYGYIADPEHPCIYYTISLADKEASAPYEWTYHIWRTQWVTRQVEVKPENKPE